MLAPPDAMPPELAAELAEVDRNLAIHAARGGAVAISMYLLFIPFFALVTITSWTLAGAVILAVIATASAAAIMAWRRRPHLISFMFAYHVMLVMIGRTWGPWVVVPGVIALSTGAFTALPQLIERVWLTIGTSLVALLAPLVLEATGVLEHTWSLGGGELVSRSALFVLDGRVAIVFLVFSHVAMLVINTLLARQLARSRRDAHHRAEMQAWHLRKLVPGSARPRA